MPIYEFRCDECERLFERLLRSRAAAEGQRCPHCGSTRVGKLFSTFASRTASGGGCATPEICGVPAGMG